jgi:hypothetical protein
MAQRFSPNTSVAEQILLNPTFANIDFADFQGLDMNLIDRNAEYTQNIANKRFEEMVQAQTKLLEDVQLHKRFDYLEKDLQNKLASVIDNAGNVQLSDNANFNKLNTNLISLKADPQLKTAVYSSEQARKMQEILEKDPTLEKRPWDAPAAINYKKFLRGETNDFELTPIYKNVDLTSLWYNEFFSKLPADQQEVLRDYGTYGLVQAKQEGRNVDQLIDAIKDFKNFTIKNNPEIVSHLERRGNYEVTTNPNVNKDQFINDYIDESARAAASKVAGISNTISSVGIKPDATMDLQWKQENRMQTAQDKQNEFYAPYDFQGGVLVKGNKPVSGTQEKNAFINGIAANLISEDGKVNTTSTSTVDGKNVTVQSKKLVDPNSLYVTTVNGQNVLKGNTLKKKPIDPIPVPPNVMLDVLNQMGGRGNSTTQQPGLNWDPVTKTYKQQ